MGALISIWGKNGSGKSTVAANVACRLAKMGHRTAIVGANRFYGAIQYYFGLELSAEQSLRNILSERDSLDIGRSFVECGAFPKQLRVASLSNDDDAIGCQKMRTATVIRFLELAKKSFEYTLIDCDDSPEDALSMLSLTMAERVLYVMKPSVQGAVFSKACESLVGGLQIREKIYAVYNCDRKKHELSDYRPFGIQRGRSFALPHCREVENSANTGRPFAMSKSVGLGGMRYRRALDAMARHIAELGGCAPSDNAGCAPSDNSRDGDGDSDSGSGRKVGGDSNNGCGDGNCDSNNGRGDCGGEAARRQKRAAESEGGQAWE
jgi:septum formation inhibitor-activating ATPase MinD